MVPMSPTTFSYWLIGVVSLFYLHIRDIAFLLPFFKVYIEVFFNLYFSIDIFFRNCTKFLPCTTRIRF